MDSGGVLFMEPSHDGRHMHLRKEHGSASGSRGVGGSRRRGEEKLGEKEANCKVMVYSVVVKECRLDLPLLSSASLLDLYGAYRAVFDRSRPEGLVTDLLQVLLAAQEPLSRSLLQQMGLAQHLPSLPGWPTLFYEAEHRVYMLHKSLSDWLRDQSKSGGHAVDIFRGHSLIGRHLLETYIPPLDLAAQGMSSTLMVPSYVLKYLVTHLCQANAGGTSHGEHLDRALASWEFIRSTLRNKVASQVVLSLGDLLDQKGLSNYAGDALRQESYKEIELWWCHIRYISPSVFIFHLIRSVDSLLCVRWLRWLYHDLEKQPEEMEKLTFERCPVTSLKYLEAVKRLGLPWRNVKVFGGSCGGNWPLDIAVLKVWLGNPPAPPRKPG